MRMLLSVTGSIQESVSTRLWWSWKVPSDLMPQCCSTTEVLLWASLLGSQPWDSIAQPAHAAWRQMTVYVFMIWYFSLFVWRMPLPLTWNVLLPNNMPWYTSISTIHPLFTAYLLLIISKGHQRIDLCHPGLCKLTVCLHNNEVNNAVVRMHSCGSAAETAPANILRLAILSYALTSSV